MEGYVSIDEYKSLLIRTIFLFQSLCEGAHIELDDKETLIRHIDRMKGIWESWQDFYDDSWSKLYNLSEYHKLSSKNI